MGHSRVSYHRRRTPGHPPLDAQAILDALDTPSALLDDHGRIVAVNLAWRQFGTANGADDSSAIGANYLDICDVTVGPDQETAQGVARLIRALLAGEQPRFSHEYPCPTVDGQRWYVVHGSLVEAAGARYVLLRHEDTTAVRRTEVQLRDSEQRYRMVWAAINDALALSDPDGIVLDANPAYYQLYGGTPAEVVGASFARIFPPALQADAERQYRETFASMPEGMLFETEAVGADGTRRAVESRIDFLRNGGTRIAMLSVIRDITERKQAAAALLERQRLEGLGLLAGGIAHDFNNLLTGVQGYAELALAELPPESSASASLEQTLIGVRHIADLTTQLLAYAGQGAPVVQPLDLNAVIREVGALLRVPARHLGGVGYELAPQLPATEADIAQMRQVVLNLITNAAEAVAETAGSVVVSTRAADLSEADLAAMAYSGGLRPGRYVILTVADTGHGMDAATLERIFDPFFSTRAFGRGLGLAAVHGIVRRHGAALRVQSQPGAGTIFEVAFPALPMAAPPPPQRRETAGDYADRGSCLVIDDEPTVRNVAERMLRRLGYTVVNAESGEAGLALLQAGIDNLAAVLVDLTMPHMSGEEVLQTIKARRPDLWVVLMSGYSAAALAESRPAARPDAYLQKPFSLGDLRGALAGR